MDSEWLCFDHTAPHSPLTRSHPLLLFFFSLSLLANASSGLLRMAAMQCRPFSSLHSYSTCQHRTILAGSVSYPWLSSCRSLRSSFRGQLLRLPRSQVTSPGLSSQPVRIITMMAKPSIQFIQGTDEQTIPDVKLTKSRDGTNGVALFTFEQPSVFDSSGELGDITGFYMIDEEGVIQSVDVSAKFVNGKPAKIEAKYIMRSPKDWDRFMRFMERYSTANGLQFVKN